MPIARLTQSLDARAAQVAAGAQKLIDRLAAVAFAQLWERLTKHPEQAPREAILAAQVEFGGSFADALAKAFGDLLQRSISTADVRAMPVSGITLSRRLYLHNVKTAAEVLALVRQHAQGVHQAQELARALYDGYSPQDGIRRPLEGSARAELPKALRALTEDSTARRDLTALMVRGQQQAARLKSTALRAAYLEAFDGWEQGAGQEALRRRLQVAQREKNRFFADRIAQTELHRAYQATVAREMMDDTDLQVVQVRMNPLHPREDICDLHARADLFGLGPGLYPKEEAPRPPFHPFCLPGSAKVSTGGRIAAVTKRWYEGDMVVITTASGKRLEATVNHPVLTGRGWVAAGLVDVGCDVVCRLGPERVEAGDVHHEHVPTSIAEVFDSFGLTREVATVEVPTAAPHFHGDGMAGQVAVVRTDRKLWDRLNAALSQSGADDPLVLGHEPLGLLDDGVAELPFERARLAGDGLVSGGNLGGSLFRRHRLPSDQLLLARGALGDSRAEETGINGEPSDAELGRKIIDGSTGQVLLDKVISVQRYPVACHVFNLETTTSHYTADGIVTHNCRCKLVSKPSLSAALAYPRGASGYLQGLGYEKAGRIMGSVERAHRVMLGESVDAVVNAGKDPAYRLVRVGDAAAQNHAMVKATEGAA